MYRRSLALLFLSIACCCHGLAKPERPRENPKYVSVSNVALLAPRTQPLPARLWPFRTGETIKLQYPLPFIAREVSPFGWRFSENQNRWRIHSGHDLIVPEGTDVFAALSGRVLMVQPINGYGLTVLLDHGNGWQSLYAHLQSSQLASGQFISQGTVIGLVGSSGRTSTPHLHFELRRIKSGELVAIDPSPLLDFN